MLWYVVGWTVVWVAALALYERPRVSKVFQAICAHWYCDLYVSFGVVGIQTKALRAWWMNTIRRRCQGAARVHLRRFYDVGVIVAGVAMAAAIGLLVATLVQLARSVVPRHFLVRRALSGEARDSSPSLSIVPMVCLT